jgi:hypothetical protein
LAVFFNPTDERLTQWIRMPLYYTGATEAVEIALGGANPRVLNLQRDYSIDVSIGEELFLSSLLQHNLIMAMNLSQTLDRDK